jgi:hypothetical protein
MTPNMVNGGADLALASIATYYSAKGRDPHAAKTVLIVLREWLDGLHGPTLLDLEDRLGLCLANLVFPAPSEDDKLARWTYLRDHYQGRES